MSRPRTEISGEDLLCDLIELGVQEGDDLVFTAALSEVGPVDGGPEAVLDALLRAVGPTGTVFGLTYTPLFKLPLSAEQALRVFDTNTPAYTGTLPNLMLQHPSAYRSRHPSCSIVGIGARAEEVLREHGPGSMAYEPIRILAGSPRGRMLLLGTLRKCPGVSTAHVAQNLLGMRSRDVGRYGVHFRGEGGDIELYVRDYVGGCSRGFWRFYEPYRDARAVTEGTVGCARSMLASLMMTLEVDLRLLKEDPVFFLCDNPACGSCRRNWRHFRTPLPLFILARIRSRARTLMNASKRRRHDAT